MLTYFPEEIRTEIGEKNVDAKFASAFPPLKNEIISVEGGEKLTGHGDSPLVWHTVILYLVN